MFFAQIVAAESDTLAMANTHIMLGHNLNTLQVSVYQNYSITIPLKEAAKQQKCPYIMTGQALAGWKVFIPRYVCQ